MTETELIAYQTTPSSRAQESVLTLTLRQLQTLSRLTQTPHGTGSVEIAGLSRASGDFQPLQVKVLCPGIPTYEFTVDTQGHILSVLSDTSPE